MTIRFELPLTKENLRERFTVEISRDGEMSFPGYEEQLEYEIAYVAMGGRKSLPLILADRWEIPAGRSHAIAHNFGLGRKVVRRIAADCVSHVADCYEAGVPGDGKFREALSHLYRSIEHDVNPDEADRFLAKAQNLVGNMELAVRKTNDKSVEMAHDALFQVSARRADLPIVRTSCMTAMAFFVERDEHSSAWDEAVVDEEAWQIRRFHDVIEALQQKKKWPPLEATT